MGRGGTAWPAPVLVQYYCTAEHMGDYTALTTVYG